MRVLLTKEKRCMLGAMVVGVMILLFAGSCGSNSQSTGCTGTNNASYGSTITVSPASWTWNTGAVGLTVDIPLVLSAAVVLPDGVTPMPDACITITGALAIPNAAGAYQFYANDYNALGTNYPVGSPFVVQTDGNGQFTFTAMALAGSGIWKDTIVVQSGAIVGTASVEIQ
jgi:hypothetical protein